MYVLYIKVYRDISTYVYAWLIMEIKLPQKYFLRLDRKANLITQVFKQLLCICLSKSICMCLELN